jgi:RNA polymerase sigma-70 factor (family 1)
MMFAPTSSDKQYLEALASGNEAAFDALFARHYTGLLRYAKSLLPYPSDAAEDVVADTFCAVWASHDQLNVQGSLASYLYAAVKNRSFDKLRQQRRSIVEAEEELPLHQSDAAYLQPDQLLVFQELNLQLLRFVEQLPERTRQVFQLHRDGNLTYEEIATLLGVSINSVKTHMFRSLRFLKDALQVSGAR